MRTISAQSRRVLLVMALLSVAVGTGCGTIKGQTATDQLLVSDAVDRTLSQISFAPLAGSKVYLDTQFVRSIRAVGCVDSLYVISAMRELMIRDGCLIEESRAESEYIVEVRMGALGTDNHEVNYGVPGSSTFNQTASLLTSAPLLPAIPEVSLAKKDERRAAVKLSVFAYNRETKEPGPRHLRKRLPAPSPRWLTNRFVILFTAVFVLAMDFWAWGATRPLWMGLPWWLAYFVALSAVPVT